MYVRAGRGAYHNAWVRIRDQETEMVLGLSFHYVWVPRIKLRLSGLHLYKCLSPVSLHWAFFFKCIVTCVQQITRTFSDSTSGSWVTKTRTFPFSTLPSSGWPLLPLSQSIWLFYGPHISEFIQCLSFCVLIISLSAMPLRITYAVACARVSLLFKGWVIFCVQPFCFPFIASWYLHGFCFYFFWLVLL